MKHKILYHGSPHKLIGEYLIPKKATDLNKNPDNLHKAVYATNDKEVAIAMAIISCHNVTSSSLDIKKKPYGIIYNGLPKQKFIYLYTLPTKTFQKSEKIKKQFISKESVKPIKIEKLKIENFLSLIRKATPEEIIKWKKKHGKL